MSRLCLHGHLLRFALTHPPHLPLPSFFPIYFFRSVYELTPINEFPITQRYRVGGQETERSIKASIETLTKGSSPKVDGASGSPIDSIKEMLKDVKLPKF